MRESIPYQSFLDEAGLNRQHVFNVDELPSEVLAPLDVAEHERQLILFAHAGKRLWECVQAERGKESDPIDEYSVRTVKRWIDRAIPHAVTRFVFPIGLPAGQHVGLQSLGKLAGWHHPTPFMLGIDRKWGSWFAYRVAILADSTLPVSTKVNTANPCDSCTTKACINSCLGGALKTGKLEFQACQAQRLREGSPCATGCNARQSCPVGVEHKYEMSQIEHGAERSLNAIRIFQRTGSRLPAHR